VLRATTDPQTTALSLNLDHTGTGAEPNDGPDSNDSPDAATAGPLACTPLDTFTTRTVWECVATDANVQDNSKLAIWIEGTGAILAGGGIRYDVHFSASTTRVATTVRAYFVRSEANPDVDPASSCATPDTEDPNALGAESRVHGCIQDQFGQPFDPATAFPAIGGRPTFEQDEASVGALQCDPDDVGPIVGGTPEDVFNADFDTDRCYNVPPVNAPFGPATDFAQYPVDLVNDDEPGTQTVTFCIDQEATGPEHGCADEPDALKATVVKIWIALPDQVFLAFTKPAPGDPADPCRTGETFKRNRVGQRDRVIACTFDSNGNPATTDQPGGGRLQWFIETTVGGERTAVKFRQQPPSETGADGTATVGIKAIRRGSNFIIVVLRDANGDVIDRFEIEKRVKGGGAGGGGRVQSQVTIRGSFKGQVVSEAAKCEKHRRVLLKKKRPGKDKTVGSDRTNNAGNWRIRKANPNGRYYAKIKRTRRCTGDKSPTVTK
jgi:hypothetical protein